MSIFSGETEVTIAVSNNKLFDSENLPSTIEDAVLTAILRNEDIPAHLQIAALTNFSASAKKYLSYGRSTYYRGLPTSTANFYDTDPDEVKIAIESEVGEPVTLIFSDIVDVVTDYEAYFYLQNEYGWTELVNEVTFGSTVYEVLAVEYNGEIPCPYDPSAPPIDLIQCQDIPARHTITYGEKGNNTNQRIEHKKNKGEGGVRYNVTYYLNSSTIQDVRYWVYKLSDKTYPELNQSKGDVIDGTFYPIGVLREKFKDINRDKASIEYNTTDGLLKKINLDINELTDVINQNPNKNDIHSAFINFALDMDTELDISNQYLALFFRHLNFISFVSKEKFNENKANDPNWQSKNKFKIKESKFNTTIKYDFISLKGSTDSSEDIGPVGTITKTKIEFAEYIPPFPPTDPDNPEAIVPARTDYTFEYQTSVGKETLYIRNLRVVTDIGSERITETSQLLIPVQVELLEQFNSFTEEKLLLDSLYLVVYAYHEEEIAWYQTSFFTFLFTLAIVAISIYFGPVNGGQLGAALTAASAGNPTLLISILTDFLITFAINYSIIWLAQELGGIVGAIFLLVSYYYLPVKYGGAGGQMKGLPFAETLLKSTSSYLQIESQEIQIGLEDIQEESAAFDAAVESRQEELENAQDLLGAENYSFNPLFILNVGMYFSPDESADSFYDRTLNFDPGRLTLDAIDQYANTALILPNAEQVTEDLISTNTEGDYVSSNWFTI